MPALLMGAKPFFVKVIVNVPSTGGGIVVVASVVVQNSALGCSGLCCGKGTVFFEREIEI